MPSIPGTRRASRARGMTLIEVIVALAVMGLGAALVAPAMGDGWHREPRLRDVVRAARSEALRRAQSLALDVTPDGTWRLTIVAADDTNALRAGVLRAAPSAPLRLRLTPLGACLAAAPVPAELEGWDAARCAVDAGVGPGGER